MDESMIFIFIFSIMNRLSPSDLNDIANLIAHYDAISEQGVKYV